MRKKIYGVTVGTPISPKAMEKELKPVKTVNGVAPDANGNVQVAGSAGDVQKNLDSHTGNKKNPHGVTAAQVGARPDTWMPSASDVGASPMEYTKKVGNPHNLLDNSDFRNPVNQRGKSTYSGGEHTIDRWFLPGEGTLTVNSGFVTLSEKFWVQRVQSNKLTSDKYTVGFMLKTGLCMGVVDISGAAIGGTVAAYSDGRIGVYLYRESESIWQVYIFCGIAIDLLYAFMYEGEYNLDTLPVYQPKGYAVELAECLRYYQHNTSGLFVAPSSNLYVTLQFPMREIPRIGIASTNGIDCALSGVTQNGFILTNNTGYTSQSTWTASADIL